MLEDFFIRRATLADVGPLVELATAAFRDTFRELDDPSDIEDYVKTAFTPEALAAMVRDPSSVLLVAQSCNALIGYAHVVQSPAPPCVTGPAPIELARLYLRQSAIGQGHGAALMSAVHAVAREAGCKTLWLGVDARNERARAFYQRWGFVDVGTKDFFFAGEFYPDPVMSAPVKEEL